MPVLPARPRRLLVVIAACSALWACGLWLTGGGTVFVGGLRLSSRSALRPAVVAFVLGLVATWGTTAADRREGLTRLRRALDHRAAGAAVLLALLVAVVAAVFGEQVPGGADASGYLHQSQLWSQGRGTLDAPVLGDRPWPLAGWEVSPLGFAPSATPGVLGPTYAPGLPWLMALGAAIAGEPGRYVWTPIAVGLLTWLTFVFARRVTTPAVALGAALLVASSPAVLFASMQTMSDLVCAALWTATLVALGPRTFRSAIVAGACAALALAVRQNLVLVAALVWAASVVTDAGTWPIRLRRALLLAAPMALVAGALAWINLQLWGSPVRSGHGAAEDLFLAGNVPGNLASLWRWTGETRAWWMALAVPGLGPLAVVGGRQLMGPALAVVAGVLASYLPYGVFAEWWYLRFYLPAWPVLATAACLVTWRALSRWSADAAPVLVVVLALAVAGSAARDVAARGVFDLWRGAQRYPAVAAWVRKEAPARGVLLSMQHSGALAALGADTVARWDHVPPDGLDARVASLAGAGRVTWAVLDDWEEADWRRRFAGQVRGRLDWAPLAEARVGTARVRVYDLTAPTRAVAPALIRVVHGGPWPWARRPAAVTSK